MNDRETRWERDGDDWLEVTVRRVPDSEVPRCRWCKEPMPGSRKDRETCSERCRTALWRRRKTGGVRGPRG